MLLWVGVVLPCLPCLPSPALLTLACVSMHRRSSTPAQLGVVVTGFSPLGSGSYVELGGATVDDSVLGQEVVTAIAAKHGKTPAQARPHDST